MHTHTSGYFVPALSLALFAVTFKFGPDGVAWFWVDQPVVALLLGGTSAAFWLLLFASRRKRSRGG